MMSPSARYSSESVDVLLSRLGQNFKNSLGVGFSAVTARTRSSVALEKKNTTFRSSELGLRACYRSISHGSSLLHAAMIGSSAEEFPNLFRQAAFDGTIGPSFNWKILNYGRILNNVRAQQAKFQELVTAYQQTVLNANREAETGS
jgi:hypothetical protein